MPEVVTGRVRKWNEDRGAGFLHADNGEDVFVVRRECGGGSLVVGAEVKFSVAEDKRGRKTAVGVHGEGVAEKGEAAAAKIAQREAKKAQEGSLHGVVARWNDLIGKGAIEYKKQFINVARWAVVGGASLVKGAGVTFDMELDAEGEKRAVNVQGEGVADEGDVQQEPETIHGVKNGQVIKWSADKSEGLVSWDGGHCDIVVRSETFSLSVGTLVSYEIEDVEGKLVAKNVEGPGVMPVQPKRSLSSRVSSMKFMKRKEEEQKRVEVEAAALKEKTIKDVESKKATATGLNSNIRVIVSDDFPLAYHAMGRKKFGTIEAAKPPAPPVPAASVKKGGDRYTNRTIKEDGPERFFKDKKPPMRKPGGKRTAKRKGAPPAAGKKRRRDD